MVTTYWFDVTNDNGRMNGSDIQKYIHKIAAFLYLELFCTVLRAVHDYAFTPSNRKIGNRGDFPYDFRRVLTSFGC
jgi:hypothetical protein